MPEPKYINLLTDYGFKRVFGNKDLLKAFLNALLEKDGKVITSITYINKEMTPMYKGEKTIFYDVLCKVDGDEDIIIEMQQKSQSTFRERAIFYMSRAFDRQASGKKNWKYKLHPVYGIFITNFHLKEVDIEQSEDTEKHNEVSTTEVVQEYVIKNKKTNRIFSDKFRMFFIDLLSFDKNDEDKLKTELDKWIYSIKNMGSMTTAPRMASSGVFRELYSAAELAAMTTRQRNMYETSLKNYRDMLADKETTRFRMKKERAEGRAEGIEIGEAKGERAGRLATAIAMKQEGLPTSIIIKCTGLSADDIDAL